MPEMFIRENCSLNKKSYIKDDLIIFSSCSILILTCYIGVCLLILFFSKK